MEILWHGLSFFEINGKRDGDKTSVVIDPFDKNNSDKASKVKADIIISSLPPTSPGIKKDSRNFTLRDKKSQETATLTPFLIEGAGEYEARGVKIKGISLFHTQEGRETTVKNTIFKIELEGIKICHLGNLNEVQIPSEILENILGIDILLIPIGDHFTISGKEAVKVITQIEPKIVIPMNYLPSSMKSSFKVKNLKINLEDEKNFLKSFGVKAKERIKKLKIKSGGIQINGTELILLEIV